VSRPAGACVLPPRAHSASSLEGMWTSPCAGAAPLRRSPGGQTRRLGPSPPAKNTHDAWAEPTHHTCTSRHLTIHVQGLSCNATLPSVLIMPAGVGQACQIRSQQRTPIEATKDPTDGHSTALQLHAAKHSQACGAVASLTRPSSCAIHINSHAPLANAAHAVCAVVRKGALEKDGATWIKQPAGPHERCNEGRF